jgi:hypothetical protein
VEVSDEHAIYASYVCGLVRGETQVAHSGFGGGCFHTDPPLCRAA